MNNELTSNAKKVALNHGADLVGVVTFDELPEHSEAIFRILPEAQSVMVVAAKHSLSAINSQNIQMGQFDTIHTYNECARAAHEVSRFLESEGFPSVAIPAFIPIDMEEPKNGMLRGNLLEKSGGESRVGFLWGKRSACYKGVRFSNTYFRAGDSGRP